MTKFLITVLVLLIVLFGVYYFLIQKNRLPANLPSPINQSISSSAEDDLTALDKDLSDLDGSDTNLTQEINSL